MTTGDYYQSTGRFAPVDSASGNYSDLAERLSDLETFRTDALAYIETLQRDLYALKAQLASAVVHDGSCDDAGCGTCYEATRP